MPEDMFRVARPIIDCGRRHIKRKGTVADHPAHVLRVISVVAFYSIKEFCTQSAKTHAQADHGFHRPNTPENLYLLRQTLIFCKKYLKKKKLIPMDRQANILIY